MKTLSFLFTLICLIFISNNTYAQIYEPISTPKIKDGNYNAIVKYNNHSTNTISTYKLVVTVKAERVIALHFPNEGSVHSGQNNSGYLYSGGNLIKNIAYDENYAPYIKSATATVQVRDRSGTTTSFSITI